MPRWNFSATSHCLPSLWPSLCGLCALLRVDPQPLHKLSTALIFFVVRA